MGPGRRPQGACFLSFAAAATTTTAILLFSCHSTLGVSVGSLAKSTPWKEADGSTGVQPADAAAESTKPRAREAQGARESARASIAQHSSLLESLFSVGSIGSNAGNQAQHQAQQQQQQQQQQETSGWFAAGAQPALDSGRGPGAPLSPVILVPGYGGSRLEARLNKRQVKHYFCERHTSDWRNIWIDLKLMLPYMIDCLIDDFRLEFDAQSNTTHNTQGVEIRVREPSDLASVEYLTDIHLASFGYFAAIIRRLVQKFGYQRDVNLRGAPYDFRKAPNELASYFEQLRLTCEQLVRDSGGSDVDAASRRRRLTLVCHSMGCNNALYFLQRQSAAWKEAHILRLVSLAAPWGGSMQAVRATAFGDNLGLPYLFDESELKIVQQSVPSTMYLFPSKRAFGDEPLLRTYVGAQHPAAAELNELSVGALAPQPASATAHSNETMQGAKQTSGGAGGGGGDDGRQKSETYTARDFKQFFDHIQHPHGYLMWLNTKDLLRSLEAPGVEVNCLYGKGHSTLARMEFEGAFPSSRERDVYADGDGTVAVQSAAFCREWSREQQQPVTLRGFYANHIEMMKDPDVLNAIEAIMRSETDS